MMLHNVIVIAEIVEQMKIFCQSDEGLDNLDSD